MINNELFHDFFYNAPNAFFLTIQNGSIIDANEAASNLLQYSVAELIEKGRDVLFKFNQLNNHLQNRQKNGSVRLEATGIKKDGTEFPVEVFSWLIKGEDGIIYNATFVIDITNNKANINHIEMLYMLSVDMIGIADNGRFLSINPAGTAILGYEQKELLALDFMELIHPDDLQKSIDERDKVHKGEHSVYFTNRYRCKDGAYKWLEWNTYFKDNKTYFVARDVTTIMKHEEHYKLLESVIAHANDAVIITEAELYEMTSPKILFINEALIKQTGYSREELIGNTPSMFQGEKTDRKELNRLKASLTKWESCEIEVLNYRKNGDEYWVNISVFPIANETGWFTHWVSVQKDVTERKKIEAALIRSSRINLFTSKINELILKATSKEEIFKKIPEIAVEIGGFEFVWFTKPDIESKCFKTLSFAGNENGYTTFTSQLLSILDVPYGNGPTGKAYRNKKYYYSNDIANDSNMLPWRDEALRRGFLSIISVPVIINEEVKYIINFYNSQVNYFNSEEIMLLETLTDNIAYSLNALYNKRKREETEVSLIKLSMAIEQSSSSVIISSLKGDIEYVNNACCRLSGYCHKELIGKDSSIFKTKFNSREEYEQLWKTLNAGKTWQGIFCNQKKNGELYWETAVISPVLNSEKVITNFISVKEDITRKIAMEEEKILLTNVIKNSNAATIISDMEDHIIFLNDKGREMVSLSLNDDISLYKTTDFLTPETNDLIRNTLIYELLKNDKWEGEIEMITLNGNKFPAIINTMLHRNKKGEPEMKSTTAINITDIKNHEAELIKLNEELRSLSSHLVQIREEERKHIAKEIHDELGQNLTLLKLDVSWVLKHLYDDKDILINRLEKIKDNTDDTIKTSRRLYNSIYPQMIDDIGLVSTIKWHSKSYLNNQDIEIEIWSDLDNDKIFKNHNTSLALFRVYQETFTNILRYAKANNVAIEINVDEDNILMTIIDNGIGFEVDKVDTTIHHGLLGMRERVKALNGNISIDSAPGKGTFTNVRIPIINEV